MRYEPSICAVDLHPVVARLVELRLAWGLTIEQIAQRAGCSYRLLAYIEAGGRDPGFKLLVRWAEVLGYDLSLRPHQFHRVPAASQGTQEA